MLSQIDAVCTKTGVWPHAVLSGHAHNYQRFTRMHGNTQIPYIICGNGGHKVEKLKAPGNRLDKLLRLRRAGMSTQAFLDELYLASLARYPSDAERSRLSALLPPPGDESERPIVEDVCWGLLSSREFLFNH